jgi:hypothetical protein
VNTTSGGPRTERSSRASSSWGWWSGLGINLVLSLLYLLVAPLTAVPHRDWAILVGSYFAAFLLADSTTTNALGADAGRVSRQLGDGTPLRRILLGKNLTLLLVVGLPTLAATAVITLHSEPVERLALTVPAVLGPVLVWLGLGNLASVLLPARALPLRQRWQQRRDLRSTGRWLAVVALPYALCWVVDPLTEMPTFAFRALGAGPDTSLAVPATVLLACGLLTYGGLTSAALGVARCRELRFHDLPGGTGHMLVESSPLALAA